MNHLMNQWHSRGSQRPKCSVKKLGFIVFSDFHLNPWRLPELRAKTILWCQHYFCSMSSIYGNTHHRCRGTTSDSIPWSINADLRCTDMRKVQWVDYKLVSLSLSNLIHLYGQKQTFSNTWTPFFNLLVMSEFTVGNLIKCDALEAEGLLLFWKESVLFFFFFGGGGRSLFLV